MNKHNSALLVIDMQNGFCSPESGMGKSVGTEAQLAILEKVGEAVEFFRKLGAPVFWSQQTHFKDDISRKNRSFRDHSSKQGFIPCLAGTDEVDFYPPIQKMQKPDDHIIVKHRASFFYETNLQARLRLLGVKYLVIAGCNTEYCVAHTVRDAYARDYELIVLKDAVAGIQPKYHELCLQMFSDYFAEVVGTDQLSQYAEPQS